MGKSKTNPGRNKVRVEYLSGGKVVHPVQINGSMWWEDDGGTVRVKTWDAKRVHEIVGKK